MECIPFQIQQKLLFMNSLFFFANRLFRNLSSRCHRGPKIQSCHHLAPHMKLRSPNLKYEALEISEVSGPFEGKVLRHYRHFGPL